MLSRQAQSSLPARGQPAAQSQRVVQGAQGVHSGDAVGAGQRAGRNAPPVPSVLPHTDPRLPRPLPSA
ncbi:hypothetical protein ACWHA1_29555, partial [Streptomyces decoyicus]